MESTLPVVRKTGFYADIVLKALSRMDKGRLDITLPDGDKIVIGNGQETTGRPNAGYETPVPGFAATLVINDPEFFRRCVLYGDIGFGESYVDGLWDTDSVTEVISWVLLNIDRAPGVSGSKTKALALNLLKGWNKLAHARRSNTMEGSRRNISRHYDLNNEFFRLFLDPTLTYSSAYFCREGMSLEDAQNAKYERLCRLLRLKSSDHVLEIGSGWGANAIYMAKHYGCRVTSVTISEEQYRLASERVREAGFEDRVTIQLKDYRALEGRFDKLVSVEMLEAVGHSYMDEYFAKCHALLKKDGILALQVITCPDSRYESLRKGIDWIQKHIFPGSLLPSVGAINNAVNRTGDLTLVDLKDLGLHYAQTLRAWYDQFNSRLSEIRSLGFDEHFVRKWNYYLCYCEAAFAMRNIHVMQLVYTRPNNTGR
jgi:cyclopropane-fatty-acyl-phospholipid synthase